MQNWTLDEISFIQNLLDCSTQQIFNEFCDAFGEYRSYDSVQKKVKQLKDVYVDNSSIPHVEEEDIPRSFKEFESFYKQEAEHRKKLKQEADRWMQILIDEFSELEYTPSEPVNSELSSMCIVLSDLHFGKKTDSFNLEVARQRIERMTATLKSRVFIPIDEIVVLLGGDLVEGEDIFATQNGKLICSAIEQTQRCIEALWTMLNKLRKEFSVRVRVVCVPGNHGRVSKTASEESNWDNVVTSGLALLINAAKDYNLTILPNWKKFTTFRVKDKTGMLTHKGVKHTGTPAMREKIASWQKKKKFDFMCHGHWHEWHVGTWMGTHVICNGCLCGPDDFAEEIAKEDDARQAYFFITPGQPVWGFSYLEWLE